MYSIGYVCFLLVILTVGSIRAVEEDVENKLTPLDEENDGRFFFYTTSSSSDSTSPAITISLGVGDILFIVVAVALSVAAGVLIAGLVLGDKTDTSGYSAPT